MFVGFSVFHSKVAALEETRSHTLEMVQIFILSFFCRLFFSFFVISVLSVIFLSFFVVFFVISVLVCHFVSFGGNCVFVLSFWCHFLNNMEKYQKLFEKCQNNDKKMTMLLEKCNFCNLQNCHFVCHVFVIWWKILSLLSFWRHFLNNMETHRKLFEKCQNNDKKMTMLREKCNFCNLQNCHFVCHVFVIWWKILSFVVILQKMTMLRGKNNFCNLQNCHFVCELNSLIPGPNERQAKVE